MGFDSSAIRNADVAQWQSNGFVNRRLWVQVPPSAWQSSALKGRGVVGFFRVVGSNPTRHGSQHQVCFSLLDQGSDDAL